MPRPSNPIVIQAGRRPSNVRQATGDVHTDRVLAEGSNMPMSMIKMKTGTRGFILAGDENFLEPTVSGKRAFSTT